MTKVQENKRTKLDHLVEAASALFTEKGVDLVSVAEIARRAGVAKGTFYLYFKDKEHLRDYIMARESIKLFKEADRRLRENPQPTFPSSILYLIHEVVTQLENNTNLLYFLRHSLSYALFRTNLTELMDTDEFNLTERFSQLAAYYGWKLKDAQKTLFFIVELAGSTCYSCLVENRPDTLENTRNALYEAITALLEAGKE